MKKSLKRFTWPLTDKCNAEPTCSYCIKGKGTEHPDLAITKDIIIGLSELEGEWRISFSGGEPTDIPYFFSDIIPFFLEKTDYMYSLVTNFTADLGDMINLVAFSGNRLERICASYHFGLNETPEPFIEKAIVLNKKTIEYGSEFKVSCVLVPSKLDSILEVLYPKLKENGIKTVFQLLKVRKNGPSRRYNYNDQEMRTIRRIVGDKEESLLVSPCKSYRGKECYAGVNYLVMDSKGNVFLCFDAMERGEGWLGNIRKDFRHNRKPVICEYDTCSCGSPFLDGNIKVESNTPKRILK